MQRIGILGGTFDPIHYGHLAIAEEVRYVLDLAYVYMVPAAHQPLKHHRPHASAYQRLEMVKLACADNPMLVPSDIEVRRPPPSFTIDTLKEIQHIIGKEAELWFIIGSDTLLSLPHWKDVQEMRTMCRLAVVARPGIRVELEAFEEQLPGITEQGVLIVGPQLDIASSMLRSRIATNKPVRYQLPDMVLEYVVEHGLYMDPLC